MRRNAFTMVELIFVIVILGILASIGIPKFNSVRDNAKMTSEIAALGNLDSAINAAIEFRLQDYKDSNISWHDTTITGNQVYARASSYSAVNAQNKVLKTILNKGEKFSIIGALGSNGNDMLGFFNQTGIAANDVLIITGEATDSTNGIAAISNDILGRPDRNDIWVFNPNAFDIQVTPAVSSAGAYAIVSAWSMKLVDVNGTGQTPTQFYITRVGSTGAGTMAVTK